MSTIYVCLAGASVLTTLVPFRDLFICSVKVILSSSPTPVPLYDFLLELVLALVEDNGNSTLALNIYPKSLFSLSYVIIEFSL